MHDNEPWAKTLLSQGIYKLRFGRRPLGTLNLPDANEPTEKSMKIKTKRSAKQVLKDYEKRIKKSKKDITKRIKKAAGYLPLGPEGQRVYKPSMGPGFKQRADGTVETVNGPSVNYLKDTAWQKMDLIGGSVDPTTKDVYQKALDIQKQAKKAARLWSKRTDVGKVGKKAAKKYQKQK
jgi:hypothetical protein